MPRSRAHACVLLVSLTALLLSACTGSGEVDPEANFSSGSGCSASTCRSRGSTTPRQQARRERQRRGGDRTQTVTALREILPRLAGQGYRFESLPGC